MPNTRLLFLLSFLVITAVVAALISFDPETLSGYGSIVSAGGGLLAVIWFSASLWYQSRQLQEQRTQFLAEFKHLQEASKRESLLAAKNILDNAEERAIKEYGGISLSSEISGQYMQNMIGLKPILESDNPQEVLDSAQSWFRKEGAALTFLKGIKSAAAVYLRSIGAEDIDYTKKPEEFVFIYGPRFFEQPFFETLHGTANLLCTYMLHMEPGRAGAQIALLAAMAKVAGRNIVKMDKLKEDMRQHQERGYSLPKIAEDL